MIRAALLCATAGLLLLGPGTSLAAFPGKPGPIAYPKVSTDEAAEGRVESIGGLFTHGPLIEQRPRQLTMDTGDHSPSYSADGRLVVFVQDDRATATTSILVMRRDGSERREVTVDGLGGADPAFFPSGEAIVFARRVEGHSHIFSIRLDGTDLRQLTVGPYNDFDPAVSPDGRRIIFSSDRDPDKRRDRSDIFTMRPDGSRLRVLIDLPHSEAEPDWAPDGRRIVFLSNPFKGPDVIVANSDGGHLQQLTYSFGARLARFRYRFHHPVFSPDGKSIAVLRTAARTSSIVVIRRERRSTLFQFFDGAGTEEEGFGTTLGDPAWGPRPR